MKKMKHFEDLNKKQRFKILRKLREQDKMQKKEENEKIYLSDALALMTTQEKLTHLDNILVKTQEIYGENNKRNEQDANTKKTS